MSPSRLTASQAELNLKITVLILKHTFKLWKREREKKADTDMETVELNSPLRLCPWAAMVLLQRQYRELAEQETKTTLIQYTTCSVHTYTV